MKLERILLPTDLSPLSEAAFPSAVAFSQRFGASITLAYVIDSLEYNATYPYPDLTRFRQEIEAAARSGLAKAAEKLLQLGATKVETVFRVGAPATELCDLAREAPGFDLCIMATHGWTGFRRFIVGSVAEAVARAMPCPFLSVHANADVNTAAPELRKILVASDLSELSDHAVRTALELGAALGASVEVAHVFRGPMPVAGMDIAFSIPMSADDMDALRESFETALSEQLSRIGASVPVKSRILENTHAAEAIAEYAKVEGFDLVVAASHGRRGFKRLLLGSVAERILRMSEVATLVVKSDVERQDP
jgi:nucleotide-binding universal stress UspA family protein